MWTKIADFFKGTFVEMRRVSWTGRKELVATTGAVLVLTLIVTLFVFGIDKLFQFLLQLLLGLAG
ncbi:preprotein translocase subunit SecE [bacterium]|nr:preprotein translocase subunit SecE [bacterium]